jgi:hypothetical protein
MRLQSRIPAAYFITSKFIEPEDPKHTHDATGMMDLLMGKLSEMFRQYGMSDDPPAATNMVDGSLDQERAMFMATHSPDTTTDYQGKRKIGKPSRGPFISSTHQPLGSKTGL